MCTGLSGNFLQTIHPSSAEVHMRSTPLYMLRTVAASLWPLAALLGRLASRECFGFLLSSALVRAFPMLQQRLRRLVHRQRLSLDQS